MMLPVKFIETVKGVHGAVGEEWLRNFQELITYCESRWALKVLDPYPLSYNFVAPAILEDQSSVVVKLSVPNKELTMEAEAVKIYDGNGMARLIDADVEKGILILERVLPGETLFSLTDDKEATYIAAQVMKKLYTPAPNNSLFPTTEDWAEGLVKLRVHFNGDTGPLPSELVQEAELLYPKLHQSIHTPILLHGDLHHGNILSAEREPWLAIDPKGVIGEAEYGVIQFLLNKLPDENRERIIEERVDIFVKELNLDKSRILSWGFCHSVLSSWWCVEDNVGGWESGMQTAKAFKKLL
jgi:streptomycin 6-kinase